MTRTARSLLPAVLLLLVGGIAATLYVGWPPFGAADPVTDDFVADQAPTVRIDESGQSVIEVRDPVVDPARDLPTARYRIVDATSGAPIAGARVYAARDGRLLASTDAEGLAAVPGGRINACVFGADGYLLDHYFDRPERAQGLAAQLARDGVVRLLLQPDDLTARCSFRFVRTDGSVATGVRFRIACVDSPAPDARSVPTVYLGAAAEITPELRSAWLRHVMLSTLKRPDFNPERLHFGAQSRLEDYACDGAATLRFVATGVYRIEASAGDEFRIRTFEVTANDSEVVTVELRKGRFFGGQVVSGLDGQPIAGAQIVLSREDGVVASQLSEVHGKFRLGPLAANPMHLHIRHPAYQVLELDGVRPGPDTVHKLAPLARQFVRGLVRRRPDLSPLAGAVVRLTSGEGIAVEGRTDSSGMFELGSHLIEPNVEIRAKGFLDYEEMLNANGEPRQFDLIPATIDERVRVGLTAVVFGQVLDAAGKPAANRPVEARPQTPWNPQGIGGRRIVRGGHLPSTRLAITDAKGRFAIEWSRTEAIRVLAVKGMVEPGDGHFLNVVLGQRHEVALRDKRD